MTIEIQQPDLEAFIRQRMESGEFQSVSDLIRRALISLASAVPDGPSGLTSDRRAEAFRRWAESHEGGTVLLDEAMARANFYGERG